jgi:hypothetical protein
MASSGVVMREGWLALATRNGQYQATAAWKGKQRREEGGETVLLTVSAQQIIFGGRKMSHRHCGNNELVDGDFRG